MVMAEIYVNCGMHDEAMAQVELALSAETFITVHLLKHTRWLNPLRSHKDYARLMRQYSF